MLFLFGVSWRAQVLKTIPHAAVSREDLVPVAVVDCVWASAWELVAMVSTTRLVVTSPVTPSSTSDPMIRTLPTTRDLHCQRLPRQIMVLADRRTAWLVVAVFVDLPEDDIRTVSWQLAAVFHDDLFRRDPQLGDHRRRRRRQRTAVRRGWTAPSRC